MTDDVQPITKSDARIAARLCNFATGEHFLLTTHKDWLDENVRPIVRSQRTSWVDLHGYASRRGDADLNVRLSVQRCEATKSWIANYANQIHYNITRAYGDSESGPNPVNNDGYYRALDIYVFSAEPPTRPKAPDEPPVTFRRFSHREFFKHSEDSDNFANPDPKDETGKLVYKGLSDIFTIVTDPQGFLGTEDKKAARVISVPPDFVVNRVTIDRVVTYDHKGITHLSTEANRIDYVWGAPLPFVTVVTNFQATLLGDVGPRSTETKQLTRKEANLSLLAKPSNP